MVVLTEGGGPDIAPASKPGVGLTSATAIGYTIDPEERSTHSRARLVTTDAEALTGLVIHRGMRFFYAVFPAFRLDSTGGEGFEATAIAVDLEFDDGTWLSQHPVTDEAGYGPSARERFESRSLIVDQWNRRTFGLDEVAGRRVVGVWASAEQTGNHAHAVHGWISDIGIDEPRPRSRRLTDLVDTRRGTHSTGAASRGNTVPAVAVPHGFNLGIPVTDASSFEWPYHYHAQNGPDNRPSLQALAVSHTPSPWIGDRGMLQLMPVADAELDDATGPRRAVSFAHADETARAHYYSVRLDKGLAAEMTATDHVVAMRFTLPEGGGVLVDQPDDRGAIVIDLADPVAALTGYTDSKTDRVPSNAPRMYFAIAFDTPPVGARLAPVAARPRVSAMLEFGHGVTRDARQITARIATSFISVEQALATLTQEAPLTLSFDELTGAARRQWERQLSVLTIDDDNDDRLVGLASSLYRLFLYPSNAAENVGTADEPSWAYADVAAPATSPHSERETGCTVRPGRSFVNNGFWDTYRTAWPAYFLLEPERAAEMLDGFVEHFRASGWVERWSAPGAVDCMVGTSSDIVIADSLASGVELLDWEAAYDSALRNATTVSDRAGVGRARNERAMFRGYVSIDVHEGLSWSLESAINDFGIARLSELIRQRLASDHPRRTELTANERYFANRARSYVHLFQNESGFFVGRDDRGSFRVDSAHYDPAVWGGDYTETNGWGMAFSVPHDGAGLAALYGGRDALEARLDQFFATPESGDASIAGSYGRVIHEMTEARDVRLGMLGLSNQPAHHIPFMYAFTNAPHKTHAIVRESVRRMFLGSDIGQGYPGDEDNGEMSAWFVFATIGLYPLIPGSGEYLLTAPAVARSTIRLANGRQTTIEAAGLSQTATYVQSVTIDGRPWTQLSVPIEVLRTGVDIVIELGESPSAWGSAPEDAPFSHTAPGRVSELLRDRTVGIPGTPFDDDSGTGALLASGEAVAHDFSAPARVDLYTVTLGAPTGSASWVIEVADEGGPWRVIDEQRDQQFRWPQQTRAFEAEKPEVCSHVRLRVVGDDPIDLRQLEFLS